MKKIYDCFTFFNELDLLELRLEELYDYVDHFVLVESDSTFTNIPKSYIFEENKHRFSKFLDKIIHVKINSLRHTNPWKNEIHQRESISLGITDADADDIIVISDADEIPRPSVLQSIQQSNDDISALRTPYFYFKLNFISTSPDVSNDYIIIASKKHIVDKHGAHFFRSLRDGFRIPNYQFENYSCKTYPHGGWHFTYLGDNAFIKQKVISFSHAFDEGVDKMAKRFDLANELFNGSGSRYHVKVDEYFPKTVLNNLAKYENYIIPNAKNMVRDYYPYTPNEL